MESKEESECCIHQIIMLYASAYDSESDFVTCESQPSDDMKLAKLQNTQPLIYMYTSLE